MTVFSVLIQEENVDNSGNKRIQEGENCNGDKELSRRRIISSEEYALPPHGLTHGRLKRPLVQPGETQTHVHLTEHTPNNE